MRGAQSEDRNNNKGFTSERLFGKNYGSTSNLFLVKTLQFYLIGIPNLNTKPS